MADKSVLAAGVAALALLASAAQAQNLPAPSLPLTGTEQFQCWQQNRAKDCTPAEILQYLQGQPLTWTAKQTFAPSTAGGAGVNLGAGATPSAPVNGDIWSTSSGVFARFGGSTVQLGGAQIDGVQTFNSRLGTVTLLAQDVVGAMNVTPNNAGVAWVDSATVSHTAGVNSTPAATPVNLIWLDDLSWDPDGYLTLEAVHHWVDTGAVNLLAVEADSPDPTSAPIAKIFNQYFNHNNVLVGAYQGSLAGFTAGSYNAGVIAQFDPGDSRSNYTSCITQLRTVLANAANASVKIAETGFATCLAGLMRSAADGISPLTGPQLIQQKVIELDRMGGDYPTGNEYNMINDPSDENYISSNWKQQNGYPPIYYLGYTAGNIAAGDVPSWFPTSNPAQFVFQTFGASRPFWDVMTVYSAIFGHTAAFTVSANGTNTVNASTGANSWSSGTASGHYYLTPSQSAAYYQAVFDGQYNTGAYGFLPAQVGGAASGNGWQCSALGWCYAQGLGVGSVWATGPIWSHLSNSSAFVDLGFLLTPNLTTGQCDELNFGVSLSPNNTAFMGMCYAGSNSPSTYGRVGFYEGSGDVLRWYTDGKVQMTIPYNGSSHAAPPCTAALAGSFAWVNDQTTVSWHTSYVSGGSGVTPIFCTGSTWIVL